jgi:hypothetical protein
MCLPGFDYVRNQLQSLINWLWPKPKKDLCWMCKDPMEPNDPVAILQLDSAEDGSGHHHICMQCAVAFERSDFQKSWTENLKLR